MPKYRFEPKSNAHLLPGQFWGVPLSDRRWACGRVLAVKTENDAYFPGNSRTFLAALMCWHGDEPPTAEAIAGRQVLAQGWAHVRTIQRNGQMILGCRDLALDGIRGLQEVTTAHAVNGIPATAQNGEYRMSSDVQSITGRAGRAVTSRTGSC